MKPTKAASLGGGVIGASWTSLFVAQGVPTTVYDVHPEVERKVRAYVDKAWPVLEELGVVAGGSPDLVSFADDPAKAVEGADFVQESVPERLPIKVALYEQIEPALAEGCIVSSSASGLTLAEMQTGWQNPSHFVLGHPFNPPHLIPLVEVMGNEKTADGVVERAQAIYEALGKVTIRINKAVPAHVSNRLQAALWREAISLVSEGVVSVEDVDKAVWAGPGLRWAAMGPNMIFNLAAGERGIEAYMEHFADSFHGWWDDLGDPRFDEATRQKIIDGVKDAMGSRTIDDMYAERDRMIVGILKGKDA